jgi:hypothetical protein
MLLMVRVALKHAAIDALQQDACHVHTKHAKPVQQVRLLAVARAGVVSSQLWYCGFLSYHA